MGRLRVLAGVLGALLTASTSGAEGVVSAAQSPGRLDVRAEGVPVGRVLRDLLAFVAMDGLWVDPKVETQPVTVVLTGVSHAEALSGVLAESRLPYALWGGAKGPWRVVVGDKDAALRVGSATMAGDGHPSPAGEGEREALAAQWQEREADARAVAEIAAVEQPITVTSDPGVPGGYTLLGDSVTYLDPTFVPYKSRPEVQARRRAIDVSTIP